MRNADEKTLLDRWMTRLKNHPMVATIILFSIAVASVGSFMDSLGKIWPLPQTKPTPSTLQVINTETPQASANRQRFKEEFQLGEGDTYVSDFGVKVTVRDVAILDGVTTSAKITAWKKPDDNYYQQVKKGDVIYIHDAECDDLQVIIKDVQLYWPAGYSIEQISKRENALLITRKVLGVVTGRCEV